MSHIFLHFQFSPFYSSLVVSTALMFLYGLGLCYRTQQIQQLSSLFLVYKLQILAIALILQRLLMHLSLEIKALSVGKELVPV
jgi:hypothetical protein